MRLSHSRLLGALALVAALGGSASAVPVAIPYTAQLTSGGSPATGPLTAVVVKLYPAPDGPSGAIWTSDPYTNVPVNAGTVQLVLAGGNPTQLDSALLSRDNLWAEITVNGNALAPRQKVVSVPAALRAADADALGGRPASDYVEDGGSAILDELNVAGNAVIAGPVKLTGSSADSCVMGAAGTIRYWSGALSYCDGSNWQPVLATNNALIPWAAITGLPTGFSDGVDNVAPQYFAGAGFLLAGNTFSLNTTYTQRRVVTDCGTSAISAIAADGTATCVAVGKNYTAGTFGGLQITANAVSLISCSTGQVLKHNGTSWACAADQVASNFAQLTGVATDAQVPDSITANWVSNTDMVDGHHYSPVWDSTDAATLGGYTPEHFASKQQVDLANAKLDNLANATPNQKAALCAQMPTTKVCKRDVWMWSTHERDDTSLMMLSGGTWAYYEEGNRCEYNGGVETAAAKECGGDLMPAWIDTDDDCGGFRQSEWDSRIWFAVAKASTWDPNFAYTCPAGFAPMTVDQAKREFKSPQNAGDLVYQNQCNWDGRIFKGQDRRYFRFIDSKSNNFAYKEVGDFEGQAIRTGSSTFSQANTTVQNFAGIVCWSTKTPGPTDWMNKNDLCGGFRQSSIDPRFRFAVSRKNVYEEDLDYQCPEGFHWATTAEAYDVFKQEASSQNTPRVYQNQCGWNGYDMNSNGLLRHNFRFADSFEGLGTEAVMHAGYGDEFTVQFDVAKEPVSHLTNPSFFAGIVCKADEDPAPSDTAWMDTTDYCGGWRQDTWDPRFYFAASKSTIWNPAQTYACPAGFKWATRAEWIAAHPRTSSIANEQRVYSNQCGWNGYVWNGASRQFWRFADSGTAGASLNWYIDSDHAESFQGTTSSTTTSFAGIVCMKIGESYPNANTTDWMETDDDCRGFKPIQFDNRLRLAVARQNIWNKSFQYRCPTGYKWAFSHEADALMANSGSSTGGNSFPYYKYNGNCGWSGNSWQGRTRVSFRFADSVTNNRYYHAGTTSQLDWTGWDVDGSTDNFAGIVCVKEDLSEGPLDWWDRSDNCGGFRQSNFDPRVRYMVARKNYWEPTKVYQCPSGYHWASTSEYEALMGSSTGQAVDGAYNAHTGTINGSNPGGSWGTWQQNHRYYNQCGWNEYYWRGYYRLYFRFSDSASNGRYAHAGSMDAHRNMEVDSTLTSFAGIVCVQDNGTFDPNTWWMDKTDNCGGWRQSQQHPDIYYAVSKSDVWDFDRVYTCPAGFTWATVAQYNAVRTNALGKPNPGNSSIYPFIYHNQCGWSAYDWNPSWRLGCSHSSGTAGNTYSGTGCGSQWNAPMPSMYEYRIDEETAPTEADRNFMTGCDECQNYDLSAACNSSTPLSGPDGKCNGVNEAYWRNGNNINDCFYSPNSFGGTPEGILPAPAYSDHCREINGQTVCCGDGEFQNRPMYRWKFRFRDSAFNPANLNQLLFDNNHEFLHAADYDGAAPTTSSQADTNPAVSSGSWQLVLRHYAGIVCIRNGAQGL